METMRDGVAVDDPKCIPNRSNYGGFTRIPRLSSRTGIDRKLDDGWRMFASRAQAQLAPEDPLAEGAARCGAAYARRVCARPLRF
jgi:hypothetical protein